MLLRNSFEISVSALNNQLNFSLFQSLQNYVREQMLQAVAVIFKRGTVETKAKGREGLFNDVSQLIGSGDSSLVSKQNNDCL